MGSVAEATSSLGQTVVQMVPTLFMFFDPDPIGAIHGIQGLEKESAMSLEATSVDLMALVRKTWIGSMNPLRMFLLALS